MASRDCAGEGPAEGVEDRYREGGGDEPKGVASIAKIDGKVSIERGEKSIAIQVYNGSKPDPEDTDNQYEFPLRTRLLVEEGDTVAAGTQITEGSLYPAELLELRGRTETALYLVDEVQRVYKAQGVDIDNRHIELIVRQMLKKVRVDQRGDSDYLPGQYVDRTVFADACAVIKKSKGEQPQYEEIILGITKASLNTDSFLSAASFQETTKVLTDAALEGRRDRLMGLKENVIIGKLIPAATGLQTYRRVEITPTEPLPAAYGAGSLSEEELAVLGLEPGGDLPGENLPGDAVGTDVLGDLNRSMGAGADGRADELASELPE